MTDQMAPELFESCIKVHITCGKIRETERQITENMLFYSFTFAKTRARKSG